MKNASVHLDTKPNTGVYTVQGCLRRKCSDVALDILRLKPDGIWENGQPFPVYCLHDRVLSLSLSYQSIISQSQEPAWTASTHPPIKQPLECEESLDSWASAFCFFTFFFFLLCLSSCARRVPALRQQKPNNKKDWKVTKQKKAWTRPQLGSSRLPELWFSENLAGARSEWKVVFWKRRIDDQI